MQTVLLFRPKVKIILFLNRFDQNDKRLKNLLVLEPLKNMCVENLEI